MTHHNMGETAPKRSIRDPEHAISPEQLREATPKTIGRWIKGQLLGNREGPQAIAPRGGGIVDGIFGILAPGWDEERRERVSRAIGPLISHWKETTDVGLEYLARLFRIVSGLELTPPRAVLDYLDGSLKPLQSKEGNLHERALGAALGSFRGEKRFIYILKRDLKDPRYTAICANALFERAPHDASDFLPDILNMGAKYSSEVHLESLLVTAIMKMTVEKFLTSLRRGLVVVGNKGRPGDPYIDMDGRRELLRICLLIPEVDVGFDSRSRISSAILQPHGSKGYADSVVVTFTSTGDFEDIVSENYGKILEKGETEYLESCATVSQDIDEALVLTGPRISMN